jgi:Lipocalin-like domain
MKKITILALGLVALMASCKKSDSTPSCEVSVAGITGNYKVSKIELVAAGTASDITTQSLDVCERDDVYQLKADKTVVYQDAGTTCGSGGTGTWDVVNGKLTISHSGTGNDIAGASVTNNCSGLVVEESAGNTTIRTTFVKQ